MGRWGKREGINWVKEVEFKGKEEEEGRCQREIAEGRVEEEGIDL